MRLTPTPRLGAGLADRDLQPATSPPRRARPGMHVRVYGWYFPHDLAAYAGTWRLPVVIEGAGTLQVGESGFRAEQARVVAVAPGGLYAHAPHQGWGRLSTLIAQRYPSARIYPDQQAMLADWPARDLDQHEVSTFTGPRRPPFGSWVGWALLFMLAVGFPVSRLSSDVPVWMLWAQLVVLVLALVPALLVTTVGAAWFVRDQHARRRWRRTGRAPTRQVRS